MMRSFIPASASKAAEALPAKINPKAKLERPRQIANYYVLIHQRIEGVKSFRLMYRPVHAYTIAAWPRNVESMDGASLDIYNRRWNTRTDSFWWSTIAYKSLAMKRTVRSYAARKLRQAFTESLKKKGFAPDGARLPGAETRLSPEPLFGTAQLAPELPILTTRMKDLVVETDKAVQRIVNFQDRRNSKPPKKDPASGKGVGGPKPARDTRGSSKQEVKASPKTSTIRRKSI